MIAPAIQIEEAPDFKQLGLKTSSLLVLNHQAVLKSRLRVAVVFRTIGYRILHRQCNKISKIHKDHRDNSNNLE
ncbi:hypothetical protein Golax_011676 [Gossypium laxum]|uniref:Uncharacterized protein n=1 Tax=Gossypium laxum TaxID=34288 RepID=A0A7J8ZLK8_9ROSI|nr:hypothetical protein [Gossypium laxum]